MIGTLAIDRIKSAGHLAVIEDGACLSTMTSELAIMTAATLGAVALVLAALPWPAHRSAVALLSGLLRSCAARMDRPGSAERRLSRRL